MPQYEYTCPKCKWEGTRICSMAERDEQTCDQMIKPVVRQFHMFGMDAEQRKEMEAPKKCGVVLERTEIPSSFNVDMKGSFQTKAILGDGTKIDGHFGREARKKGTRYKP